MQNNSLKLTALDKKRKGHRSSKVLFGNRSNQKLELVRDNFSPKNQDTKFNSSRLNVFIDVSGFSNNLQIS